MSSERRNKGKQVMDRSTEFMPPGETSADRRIVFSRRIAGVVSPTRAVDHFHSLFKVSRKTFTYVCSIVREPMMSQPANLMFDDGRSMSLNDQVAIALRRLSSVDSMTNVANLFGTNLPTVSHVTWRFVDALQTHAIHHLQWPSEMANIKSGFERIGGLPNCCGAIETTHLKMYPDAAERQSKLWLDRQNNSSMLLQAIVDHHMRIMDVVAGWPGHMSNADTLRNTTAFDLIQTGARLNGNEIELPDGTKVREYLIGGTGFPLLPWLMTPYQDEQLSKDQSEFNKKLLESGLIANRALKKLKDVWAVVDGSVWRLSRHVLPRIILACCILHNIVIDMEGDGVSDVSTMSCEHDLGYLSEKCEFADKDATVMRDNLSLYLAAKLPDQHVGDPQAH